MEDGNYQKLKDYTLSILSFRPRSTKEIKTKLLIYTGKKKFSKDLIDMVIEDLSAKNYINDKVFAKWWKEQRQGGNPKGERFIKNELLEKGIAKEIIAEIFERDTKEDEFTRAIVIAQKKASIYKNLDVKNLKIKMGNLLVRRGFSWETISKVIDYMIQKVYNKSGNF